MAIAGPAVPGSGDAPLLALARFIGNAVALTIDHPRVTAEGEAARRETELVLCSVADGIHLLDAEGRIRRQNAFAMAILGWREEEALGQAAHVLAHQRGGGDGGSHALADCPIQRTLRDGITRRVEDEVFFRKDGTAFPVEYECSPVRDENGLIDGAVVSVRDVTERWRSQLDLRERIKELP